MLDDLRIAWARESVLDQHDEPLPRTEEQWRVRRDEKKEKQS